MKYSILIFCFGFLSNSLFSQVLCPDFLKQKLNDYRVSSFVDSLEKNSSKIFLVYFNNYTEEQKYYYVRWQEHDKIKEKIFPDVNQNSKELIVTGSWMMIDSALSLLWNVDATLKDTTLNLSEDRNIFFLLIVDHLIFAKSILESQLISRKNYKQNQPLLSLLYNVQRVFQ